MLENDAAPPREELAELEEVLRASALAEFVARYDLRPVECGAWGIDASGRPVFNQCLWLVLAAAEGLAGDDRKQRALELRRAMLGGVERRAVQHAGHFERPADDALSYTDWLNAGLQADAAYASRTICVCDAASGAVEIYVSPSVQRANLAGVVDVEAEAVGGP